MSRIDFDGPGSPRIVDIGPTVEGPIRAIRVLDELAYLGTPRQLFVVDISDEDEASIVEQPGPLPGALDLELHGQRVLTYGRWRDAHRHWPMRLNLLDLGDPARPLSLDFDWPELDVNQSSDIVALGSSMALVGGRHLVDLSENGSPKVLASADDPSLPFSLQVRAAVVSDRHLILADLRCIRVFGLPTLHMPPQLAAWEIRAEALALAGDTLYAAAGMDGLYRMQLGQAPMAQMPEACPAYVWSHPLINFRPVSWLHFPLVLDR